MSDPTTNEDYWLNIVRNGYGYSDDAKRDARLHLADSFEQYRQQLADTQRLLAESQAREKAKHDALEFSESMWVAEGFAQHADAQAALSMPSDSTALDAAIAKAKRDGNADVLIKAAKNYEESTDRLHSREDIAWNLRRMADELKGGEQ